MLERRSDLMEQPSTKDKFQWMKRKLSKSPSETETSVDSALRDQVDDAKNADASDRPDGVHSLSGHSIWGHRVLTFLDQIAGRLRTKRQHPARRFEFFGDKRGRSSSTRQHGATRPIYPSVSLSAKRSAKPLGLRVRDNLQASRPDLAPDGPAIHGRHRPDGIRACHPCAKGRTARSGCR
jgi:hypothetical protein